MSKWLKALKFVASFMAFAYIGGAMFAFGAYRAAEIVGVIVVIDESGWSANGEGDEQ